MAATSFFSELKRRNVIRMAGLYLVGAWLIVQVASTLLPAFGAPAGALRATVILLSLGFPAALAFAWVFELTPDGLKRDADVPPEASIAPQTARRMEHLIVVLLLLAVGYFALDKFVLAPKRAQAVAADSRSHSAAPAPRVAGNSIAVLPFVDMSQGKDQEYFSDGLSEQLLNELAQIPGLHVAGRTSSFYFKGRNEDLRTIGKKLNVATVLEGSVAKSGNTLRVTAQLINADDGYHLWSHTYDREFKDVFALQDEIAAAVVEALKLKLLPGQAASAGRHVDPQAYNQFLIGRKLGREQSIVGWNKAIQAYRKALAIDPDYAAAHASLADLLYEISYFSDDAATVIAKQEAALREAETAVRLDPGLGDAYRVRARIRSETRFDQAGAMTDIRRALQLSPNDSDVLAEAARLFTVSRRFDEAQAVVDKAVELDPLSTDALLSMAELQMARGDWAGARDYFQRILQIAPASNYASSGMVQAWLGDGNPQAALAAIPAGEADARTLYSRALVQHSLGNRQEADRALDEFIARYAAGWAYQIGVVYAWRGEKDKAFEWLERAWLQHDGGLLRIDTEPMLAPLWKDPRYPALRKKVGFTEP
jgi:TolB-like protein/Tfp pilus assembly protein PilF